MSSDEDAVRRIRRIQQEIVAASGAAQAVESVRQQIAAPTVQFAEAMSRLERMAAPSSQFLAAVAQMQRTVMPPGHSLDTATQGSMRRITEMVAARAQSRADDVLARIGDLASSGVLDGEVLEQTEQQLVADAELSAAVDDAAAEVARNNPLISRSNARRLVIAWIYLVCWVGLVSLAASPAPTIFSIILAAAGADASRMGTIAGEAFEKLFPPTDGDSPNTGASNPES